MQNPELVSIHDIASNRLDANRIFLGVWGVPAYLMQGVHAEVSKKFAKSVENYIITSRILQGQKQLANSTPEEQDDILARWYNLGEKIRSFEKLKGNGKQSANLQSIRSQSIPEDTTVPSSEPQTGWQHTRRLSWESRKRLHVQKDAWKQSQETEKAAAPPPSILSDSSQDAEFEKAIQTSVKETSRGNAEEDAKVEAAIRQSVSAVRQHGALPVPVPVHEKEKASVDADIFEDDEFKITDEEYQQLIEQALQESLASESGMVELPGDYPGRDKDEEDSSGPLTPATEFDPDLQHALKESKKLQSASANPQDEQADAELERALAASKEDHEKLKQEHNEEDEVMEAIKKQSLAEAEDRKHMQQRFAGGGDEDDDLKKALEESLKMSRGDDSGPSGSASGSGAAPST